MSAKSKKRLCKLENKLQKLDKLELQDVICPICQSILTEPVTLPCFHDFCHRCFNGTVENNALCCPLCRLRIGSWLRTATKQNSLVNVKLWDFMKSKFSKEIDIKLKGEDIDLPEEIPLPRLSTPGEIRSEYEAELQRIRAERQQQDQKQIEETQLLIKKIQQEDQEVHRKHLERLKQDELLAKQIQKQESKVSTVATVQKSKLRQSLRTEVTRPRLKTNTIDGYLAKTHSPVPTSMQSPLLTDDNTSTDGSTPKAATVRPNSRASPEVVPCYGKPIKNFIDKRIKNTTNFWNKENGEKDKKEDPQPVPKEDNHSEENKEKDKEVIKSLLVSLPLPNSGVLQHKITETNRNLNRPDNRNLETGSADSMRQELCFFKPIEKTSPTSVKNVRSTPLRVPCVRAERDKTPSPREAAPSRAQYIEGLCQLRNLSLANNMPSAFVIALNILRVKRESAQNGTNLRLKKNPHNKKTLVPRHSKTNLRRTRSMGSIAKDENETTPKKAKVQERKSNSERKPHLRSDSKKSTKKICSSPTLISKTNNNNKLNLAVKNLSSPLKNCDVKKILQEQLRIEKIIEQEKKDLELARQMEAEWNGRRQLRRAPGKRQVTLNYALRPAKKLKA